MPIHIGFSLSLWDSGRLRDRHGPSDVRRLDENGDDSRHGFRRVRTCILQFNSKCPIAGSCRTNKMFASSTKYTENFGVIST
eukprot:scaffold4658_cov118-Cylindrotheca_fusiformis.AAC.14